MAAFRRRRQSLSEAVGSGVRPASPFLDQSFTSLETRQSSSLHRLRVNTLEEVNISDHEIQALRSRVLHHRGSVRGTFTTESRLLHRVRRFVNKIGSSREHYSLFIFHKNGWFRKNVKKIAKSGVFKLFMALVVLLHFVTQCFYIPTINGDDTLINTVIYYVTVVVLVLYIMEAVLNIIAYSLVHSPKAYLRKYAHVLDIFVIIVGILYIATSNINPLVGEIFASFMAFKLIKLFALSESVQFILKALAKSVAPLFYLGVLTFIVITFLALIGIQLFNGRLHKGCFASHLTPAGINRTVLVSEFPCTQNQSIDGSHSCPYGSTCAEWPEGPRRGIISFDNMIFAYLTVFQVISLEGWITILYLYESAMGYQWVWAYFIVVMFFGSIFILNLWTGVLTSVFIGVSDREKERGNQRQLKETQRITEDLQNYNDWLRIAAEMDAPSDTGSIIDRRHSLFLWTDPDLYSDEGHDSDEESENSEALKARGGRRRVRELWHRLRKRVRKMLKHKLFLWSVLTVHAVNLILLMSLHFDAPRLYDDIIFGLNYLFSVIYVTVLLMRLATLSRMKYSLSYWRNYWTNSILFLVEILLSVLTILDLFVFEPIVVLRPFHLNVVLNAVWCLKLILFFKYTRSWGAMKEILRTLIQLLPSILSLMALMVIFLFFFTILGIRLFGERLSNTGIVEPNFDTFGKAFLSVFQLMTSEDWNNLLFTSLDHWIDKYSIAGGVFAVYFVIGVSFGSFVLLVVFLAMSVDKLSEVRSLESDSAEEHQKKEKQRNETKQYISDLKKEPVVKRQTIRRARKHISGSFAENVTVKQHRRKFSLKFRRNGRELSSSPSDWGSPVESREMSRSPVESPAKKKPSVKPRNPLRLMKQRSEFFEQQKLRGLEPELQEDLSTNPHRQPSLEKPHKTFTNKLSLDSASHGSGLEEPPLSPIPYTRTQSSPADSPLSLLPDVRTLDAPKLVEPITEIQGVSDSEASQDQCRNRGHALSSDSGGCPPSAVDEQLASALTRGYSLEDFNYVSAKPRRAPSEHKTASKLKEKVRLMLSWVIGYVGTIQLNPAKELAEIPEHSSFFILSPDNRFREWCYKAVSSKVFTTITLVVVLLSSLVLTAELPLGVRSNSLMCSLQNIILYLDIIFLIYFSIEMALKMVALGVVLHKGSYLRGAFNILDFLILIFNIAPIVVYYVIERQLQANADPNLCIAYSYHRNVVILAVLRVFRVMRPLKAIRIGGLYLVVSGLFSSIKSMGSIFFMTILVLIVFSVTGVLFFRGKFYYCTDPVKTFEQDCSGSYFVYDYTSPYPQDDRFPGLPCPQLEERQWMRRGLNFDNVGLAFLALFSMLTIEGWQNVMYSGLNSFQPVDLSTPQGQVPGSTESPLAAVFFIVYMIVMALILAQLFTGFLIVTFQEDGVKTFRETKLSKNERNCLYFALNAKPIRQYVPKFELHRKFHEKMLPIVNHAISKFIIVFALIVNCILLALVMYGNEDLNCNVYYINIFFTVFFAFEAVMKIIVLTPPTYFRSVRNVFDCLIAVASLLELIFQSVDSLALPMYENSLITSSFRVLRLLSFIPNVRLILWTVVKSLEIFPWVGFLLMIVFFMYTVIGMQVFGDIRRAPIDEVEETEITVYNNFANFPQALLVMIRMATGENWQDIMLSCVPGQDCELEGEAKCGSDFAYIFFPTFYFISSIIILNLLVAIVIDNFDYIVRDRSILGAHQLDVFVNLWSRYDPRAQGVLPSRTVLELMRECNPPVGWGRLCPELQAYKKMMMMNMPTSTREEDGGRRVLYVSFNATLLALVRTSLKIHCSGCPECARKCNYEFKNKLSILFPTMPSKKIDEVLATENVHTVGQEYAALLVQRVWRGYIHKRRKVLELFHGKNRRVLKAGLRIVPDVGSDLLRRNPSDFEFVDLPPAPSTPPQPRRISKSSSIYTESTRSPGVFTTNLFNEELNQSMEDTRSRHFSTNTNEHTVTIEPAARNRRYSPVSMTAVDIEPPQRGGHERVRLHSLEETRELSTLVTHSRKHSSQTDPVLSEPTESEAAAGDNVSELSFTSAYSNPFDKDNERMETTV